MRILGIDYGTRRIGLAISDPTGSISQPLPALTRRAGKRPPIAAIVQLTTEKEVAEIVIGLPLSLAGDETDWTREVRAFGAKLAERSQLPVAYVDERMTSARAEKTVRSLGLKRSARQQKERVDTTAALLILQAYLDAKARD